MDAFPSPVERRRAWLAHREQIMQFCNPLARPSAWWCFDAPRDPRPDETDVEFLARHGLLNEVERALLVAMDRRSLPRSRSNRGVEELYESS